MAAVLPTLLLPGLLCSARLYAAQIPALWQFGPVTVADHRRDDSITAMAARMLAHAPPRFALLGLSMGGYIAFELLRQAPERVLRLALLDTSARADTAEQSERRRGLIERARGGGFDEIADLLYPVLVHPDRHDDPDLRKLVRGMAAETGVEAFIRQQSAIINRCDSRPQLAAINCPTLILVGEADQLTPPEHAQEIAEGIRGARLVVIAGSGHLSALEQPQRVNAALVEWLGQGGNDS
jgi:pimeloyl-ACP methyl ester carboxylesterase